MQDQGDREKVMPSAFMRRLRPEYYSDTSERTTYELERSMLEYHLDTITARNQTHAFEIFCRKLCERTICPNLRPATGPEGGGDAKADTETFEVAEEISTLSYVGEPNAGRERWAFAFSAKKKWVEKIRSDVQGIVATQRGYQKIFCITPRFARAKERAKLEDELGKKHGVKVTIHDRSWIVEQVIDGDRKDLAFNYLNVGREVADPRLGPSDYSRRQQLEDIEQALADPERFAGMERQRATEALVAAKLSRNLERPRIETDGRFARAIRLAEADGSQRQLLEAHYERIWTGFWWFDDFELLNTGYDAFEVSALEGHQAKDLEFLCNLMQLLFNSVIHGHCTAEELKLDERVARLRDRLDAMASDIERPNNALQARMSLLTLQTNAALVARDPTRLTAVWPKFSEVVEQAKGLGEFPADQLVRMVEAFGTVATNDPGYARLVDQTAAFVAQRKSEAEGALILLKRAQQLDLEEHRFEMIRLLGKAAHQLTKKEYGASLIEAMRLLALAYRGAGLLWASRASCIFAIASMFIEAEDDAQPPASIVPSLMMLAWVAVELRHFPDALEAIRLVRGCLASMPFTDESKELARQRLERFDMVLASHIVNFKHIELEASNGLPDVLAGLALHHSRMSLLYALGYEALLREKGALPPETTADDVEEFMTLLASQLAADDLRSPVIFNRAEPQLYASTVLGVRIEVRHNGAESSSLVAEAVIGAIEALFATTIDLEAPPHTEIFSITIEEAVSLSEPTFTVDTDNMTAIVRWPEGRFPATVSCQEEVQEVLVGLAGAVFMATCAVRDPEATFTRFFSDDAVLHRIAMIVASGNSRTRIFGGVLTRIDDWVKLAQRSYPLQPTRPEIVRSTAKAPARSADAPRDPHPRETGVKPLNSHRNIAVRSVIDHHLWNRAGWSGTAFADWGPAYPPAMALLFTDREAARKIFERWRDRFSEVDEGEDIYVAVVRGVSADNPAHYRVMITSRPDVSEQGATGRGFMVACRTNTMTAETDANLAIFLEAYGRSQSYALMPAIWKEGGQPELLPDLAIYKRHLSVKLASEVSESDVEFMAVRSADEPRPSRGSGS